MLSRIPRRLGTDAERALARQALIGWRESLDEGARVQADASIGERLVRALAAFEPGVLGAYSPIRGEPRLDAALARLCGIGWTLALPRVAGRGQPLEFGRWTPGAPLAPGPYRTLHPEPFEPVVPAVLVVPCVGFDTRGFRLGYGGGFYDRTLALHPAVAVGVAYDGCELGGFEPGEHDRALAMVVTESRLILPA